MNSDNLTTILGIITSTLAVCAQQNIAPGYTGPAAAIAGALFAFYTNKPVVSK